MSAALDTAEQKLGSTVNVVVNCAGIAVAQRVLSKKGVHPLDSFLKVSNYVLLIGGPFQILISFVLLRPEALLF